MRDEHLSFRKLMLEAHRRDAVPDERQTELSSLVGECIESVRCEADIDLDEVVAVRLRKPDDRARLVGRLDDEAVVFGVAVDEEARINVRRGNRAAVRDRHRAVDETGVRVAHVEDARHTVREIDREIVLGLRMRVHVGEARR
jgi:hypothetical protein